MRVLWPKKKKKRRDGRAKSQVLARNSRETPPSSLGTLRKNDPPSPTDATMRWNEILTLLLLCEGVVAFRSSKYGGDYDDSDTETFVRREPPAGAVSATSNRKLTVCDFFPPSFLPHLIH